MFIHLGAVITLPKSIQRKQPDRGKGVMNKDIQGNKIYYKERNNTCTLALHTHVETHRNS